MKGLKYIVILLTSVFLMPSCIDEYHGDWESVNERVLVVSGSIESENSCEFILRRSNPINGDINSLPSYDYDSWLSAPSSTDVAQGSNKRAYVINDFVSHAVVAVESESGARYECEEYQDGHYVVSLDKLDPDDKYFLRIVLSDGEEYTSTPMKPLDAPEIVSAGWKKEGSDVHLNVTTEDLHEPTYFSWDYYDVWEVVTPMQARVKYDPEENRIVAVSQYTNRGWIEVAKHPRVVSDNKNYGYGALKKYPLYKIDKDDQRFQVKYYTRIRQMAISREEYEYNNLILLYNSQMGGLFTPMPSELPTNIRSAKGKRGVGYIGVRGKVSEAVVCIGRGQVGCTYYIKGETIPSKWIEGLSNFDIYNLGYRVFEDDIMKGTTWTYPYCIDVAYFGASLRKPSFWDDLKLTPEDE